MSRRSTPGQSEPTTTTPRAPSANSNVKALKRRSPRLAPACGRNPTRPGIGALTKMPSARTLHRPRPRPRPPPLAPPARQPTGRDADQVEGDQQDVAEPRAQHTARPIAPPPRDERSGKRAYHHPTPLQPANHVYVFHDGNICVSPDSPEQVPPDEQPLVAVRQAVQPLA